MAVSCLALNALPARGGIGVVGVSPRHANPGEEVNVVIDSGTCFGSVEAALLVTAGTAWRPCGSLLRPRSWASRWVGWLFADGDRPD